GALDLGEARIDAVRLGGRAASISRHAGPPGAPDGVDFAGSEISIAVPEGCPVQVALELRFELLLPERFGRLGRASGRVSLTAPWYPLLLGPDGEYRHSIPQRLRVEILGDWELLALGRVHRGRAELEARLPYLPLILAERWHRRILRVRRTQLHLFSPEPLYEPPPPSAQGEHALRDLLRIDLAAEVEATARAALATAHLAGLEPRREPVCVVLSASRTELAARAPGLLLLSDRAFEVFPLEIVRAFHRRALLRAFFRVLLEPGIDALEPARDRDWAEDWRAVLLTDLDDMRLRGRVHTPADLVGWAAFHPLVDQLLYAPQVAFLDVFFNSVSEPDRFREAPERARRPRSRGRRLLEAARDQLPAEAFDRLARGLLARREPARALLERIGGAALLERLEQWLRAPELELNYRLGRVRSRQLPDGSWTHRIEILRDGADRQEPVEVRIEDIEGARVEGRWDGPGPRGVVELRTAAAASSVHIDPRARLVQNSRIAEGHPRRDDTDSLPWRPPILQAFDLAYLASEGRVLAFVDFALRRRYDLETGIGLRLETNPRFHGGSIRYLRGFGPKRDDNGRIGSFSLALRADRLRAGFAEGGGGVRLSGILAGGVSTRRYFLDPRRGYSFGARVQGGLVRRDDASLGPFMAASARANLTLPMGLRAALVLVAGASAVIGATLPGERPGLGGRFLLRGYLSDEIVGDARLFAVAEERITVLSDLAWNAAHLAWIREVQLAIFAGGGLVFGSLEGSSVVPGAELGLGLRLHFEYGGVQPGVLSIDCALPLLRDAQTRAMRFPVGVHLAFDQYF
ncbi:MAG: hypothetical protein OEY14_15980, partial [Myxococcales bacterium]|nr:hypothetical protein [Myxococcales bacterium]